MPYPPELVLRVNEIFHDLEGRAYETRHPEIFTGEAERWRRVAGQFIGSPNTRPPIRLIDIGCGTGFVPLQLRDVLAESDTLVSADLSAEMLRVCDANLTRIGLKCRREFLKLDGREIDQPAASFDVVTMNSVVHHIPDLPSFLREVVRILKPNGTLIVGHEPNKAFYASSQLQMHSRLASTFINPRQAVAAVLRRVGLIDWVKRHTGRFVSDFASHREMVDAVNRRLTDERMISTPLTADEITELIDIQSPTAGGFHPGRGIDPRSLADSDFRLVHLETYNHLGDGVAARGCPARSYAQRLARRFPDAGATFFAVYRKVGR